MSVKSGMTFYDVHFPIHDVRAYEIAMQFAEDFKPDIFVNGGDLGHFGGVSHWNKTKYKLRQDYPVKVDLDCCYAHHKKQREINPDAEIYTLEGNHEEWIDYYLDDHPEMVGYFDYKKDMGFKEFNVKYVSQKAQPLKIGKIRFIHGWFAGIHHAKKHAEHIHNNVVYGHAHDMQSHTPKNIDSHRRFMSWCVGHLSDESKAEYLRNRPTNWMLGFAVFYVDTQTGAFTLLPIPMPNYQFMFGGKLYK